MPYVPQLNPLGQPTGAMVWQADSGSSAPSSSQTPTQQVTLYSPQGDPITINASQASQYPGYTTYKPTPAPALSLSASQVSQQGKQSQGDQSPLKLPSGQTISPQDPNYSAYALLPGVTKVNQPSSSPSSTQQGGMVTLNNPNGMPVSVQSSDVQNYLSQGFTQPGGQQGTQGQDTTGSQNSTPGAGSTSKPFIPYTDASSAKQYLQSQGMDSSGLSDEQAIWAANVSGTMQTSFNVDKGVDFTQGVMGAITGALTTASNYLDPRYADQWNTYSQQITQQVGQITGDYSYQQQQVAQQQQAQNDQLQQQIADAGLAQSGIRQKAEQQLQTQQEGVVSSNRRALQSQVTALGNQAEQAYGAKGAALVTPVAGTAYNPLGVQYATQPEAQKQATLSMAQSYMQNTALPALSATPTIPTIK